MDGVILKLDTVTIYQYSAILAFAFLWGSFVAYKKGIESHFEEVQVLDAIVLTGFWSFFLGRVIYGLFNIRLFWNNWPRIFFLKAYPGIEHWGLLLGIVIAIFITARGKNQKFFDWFDMAMMGVIGGMSVYFGAVSIGSLSVFSVTGAIISTLMFVYLWRAEKVYRTYGWYKNKKTQSRSGFIGGVALSYYGLIQWLFLWFSKTGGVWIGLLNIMVFVAGFVIVYSRSGRSLSEDLKFIHKLKNARK